MIRRTLPITPAIIGTKLLGVLRLISGEGLGVISCGEGVIPCGEGLGGVLICGERLGAIITDGDGGGSVGPEETTVMLLVTDLYAVLFPVMDM
jgi:hypothetical protein